MFRRGKCQCCDEEGVAFHTLFSGDMLVIAFRLN